MDIDNRAHFRKLDSEDFQRMNIGRSYWNSKLETIDDDLLYKKLLIKFINNLGDNLTNGKGFFFWGERGTGKTSAAVILAMSAVAYNHTYTNLINRAYMITINDAINIMWGNNWEAKDMLYDNLNSVDLFVFDELGFEMNTSGTKTTVENLVRTRLASGKSLIVTTNLDNPNLKKRYGPSLMKVLVDGGCSPIRLEHNWRDKSISFKSGREEDGK